MGDEPKSPLPDCLGIFDSLLFDFKVVCISCLLLLHSLALLSLSVTSLPSALSAFRSAIFSLSSSSSVRSVAVDADVVSLRLTCISLTGTLPRDSTSPGVLRLRPNATELVLLCVRLVLH